MNYLEFSYIFKALSDATRLEIVDILKNNPSICACKLLDYFAITQPTLSYHMKILVDCGLVSCFKDGIWNHYSLNTATLDSLSLFFK